MPPQGPLAKPSPTQGDAAHPNIDMLYHDIDELTGYIDTRTEMCTLFPLRPIF